MKANSIFRNIIAAVLALVTLCIGAVGVEEDKRTVPLSRGRAYVIATPTDQSMSVSSNTKSVIKNVNKSIPMYSIPEQNGWAANYVKLRDIAYYIDFDVQWNQEKPDEMRIYTNRHYMDSYYTTGPATEPKTATLSTMKMYVNDIEVPVTAYMIDNNNYFKIRDLAKTIGFYCVYDAEDNRIGLNKDYIYYDGDQRIFTPRTITYESPVWYDASSGTLSDTPVELKASNPWARKDYFEEYASDYVKEYVNTPFGVDPKTAVIEYKSGFNALVQLLIDKELVESDHSGAKLNLDEANYKSNSDKEYLQTLKKNMLNPNYKYPLSNGGYYGLHSITSNVCGYPIRIDDKNNVFALQSVCADERYRSSPKHEITTRVATTSIIAEMNSLGSDREKLMFLGREVCKRITYAGYPNSQKDGLKSATEMIQTGELWKYNDTCAYGICESYTNAFEQLCSVAGYWYLDCKDADHRWCEVWVPDEHKWVIVDCTWADGPEYNNVPDLAEEYETKYLCSDLKDYYLSRNMLDYHTSGHGELLQEAIVAADIERQKLYGNDSTVRPFDITYKLWEEARNS